jgi:membrane protease YdiL (CAAX protease family)
MLLAPITLFVSVYLATFLFFGNVTRVIYWSALIAVVAATALTNFVIDRGKWRIGFFVAPRFVIREFVFGSLFAIVIIGIADLLVIATTTLRHAPGRGFPWREFVIVYAPAAIHEELLFRGYLFQKLRAWHRLVAIAAGSIVFGALHTNNFGVTALSVVNIIIAGVLLALAYELFERLWFPIGLHLAWNLATGPILGYSVSGYDGEASVFRTVGGGPSWLTGGSFGLEGSIWVGVVELAAVAAMLWLRKRRSV